MKENVFTRNWKPILFCVVCVCINLVLNRLVNLCGLPLFVDNVGTLLAAILGGYLPGIAVGYLTNIVNMTADPTNAYYAVLSVMIAASGTFLAKRGFFSKFWKSLLTIPIFTLIGGAFGSILTFLMYGYGIGEGISAPFARSLLNSGTLTVFQAQMISDVTIDLVDKTITVLIVFLLLKLLPKKLKDAVALAGWRQTPMTESQREEASRIETRKLSLQQKIVILISIIMIFLVVVTTAISFLLYRNFAIVQYTYTGESASELAATAIDGDRVEDYLAYGEEAEGYLETEQNLRKILESSPDIEYVYVYQVQRDGVHVVFDLDTEEFKGDEPGDVIEFDDTFGDGRLEDFLAGKHVDTMTSNGKYGWLLTSYTRVYDSAGNCVCYAGADIRMEDVALNGINYLTKVGSLFLGFIILIIALAVYLAEYHLVFPIFAMTYSARKFAYGSDEAMEVSLGRLQKVKISTGDEIENLYESISRTMAATVGYIEDVEEKGRQLSKMQHGLIYVLADLVESRDKNTGDHVRKTAAYVRLILQKMKEKGVYADQLTEEYMEDVANSASLHDVGKIKVSDLILNKPGKLTDEEFAEMKNHTTAGREIIDSAMELVSDSGYLKEARNLAAYHHEKWDGSGYPEGLAGENIPLSARIMAIADVFDALVSVRSYKKPFSFEKAMDIIREGAGKHFDPELAELFLDASEEVRSIAEAQEEARKAGVYGGK